MMSSEGWFALMRLEGGDGLHVLKELELQMWWSTYVGRYNDHWSMQRTLLSSPCL